MLSVCKGWKKRESNKDGAGRSKFNEMAKEKYEGQASEIRAKLSKAKAEIERIKTNGKITKKGKRNRAELKKECKTLTVANLVAYMEKEKSNLRRLKRGYWSRKKQHEARQINRQFQLDPRRVYGNFKEMIEAQGDSDKPKYDHGLQDNRRQDRMFTNIEEAASFWRSLWEAEGTGDTGADWLEEVRCAIREKVPEPTEKNFILSEARAAKVIGKKRNWSAPGPDRLANYWWKRAKCLHEGIAISFEAIARSDQEIPMWFAEGKSSLIPKPGEFTSANQRPITCLNTMYEWFSSCLLKPVDQHLDTYGLMEGEQRGAKENCSGTMDNLLVDRMVCQDSQRGRRNLSMAWVDVRKAYDSVDHKWLKEMFALHRFPTWIGNLIARLCGRWNTKITAVTKQGVEISERIAFRKGLPQGDALCPRLFTLCLNPIAWKLKASEGYRLSKPISAKITDLLYIDDLKIYAASEAKLEWIMKGVRNAMEDVGLQWNERKCTVVHVRRGRLQESEENRIGAGEAIASLREDAQYKFLGVLENVKQQDGLVLEQAEKEYLKRLSVVWSSPLSDYYKVLATKLVREFEERAVEKGRRSMLKDASGFARELGIELELEHPEPVGRTENGELVDKKKIGVFAKKALYTKRRQGIEEQSWQGKLVANRWQDDQLDRSCFSLLCEWRTAPTYTIAALEELYQQLLPTKVYSTKKAKTSGDSDVRCRLCGKGQESVAHVLAGCSALAQTAYLTRHNAAFKILFFELLRDHGLVETVPPWYSPTQPKPIYEGERVTAYWDVPVFADQTEVRANRIDGRIVNKARKTVTLLEMSCPWVDNRDHKDEEKTMKYAPLRLELKRQYLGFNIVQYNIIIDVLGGYSKDLKKSVRELVGSERSTAVLGRMQKSVVSSSLKIARSLKIMG